jgi:hypothetical protein
MAVALVGPEGILAPLNRRPYSQRTKELVELVRTLQKIDRIEAVGAEVDRQLSQEPNYEAHGPPHAPSHMYARANEILSACRWSPRVAHSPNGHYFFTWRARTLRADWENSFVFWLLNLRVRGDISRIRSCRNCEDWFYAVTNHQTHCGDRCRQHFHSTSAVFKEKRRLYMKEYRRLEKARDLTFNKSLGSGRSRKAKSDGTKHTTT